MSITKKIKTQILEAKELAMAGEKEQMLIYFKSAFDLLEQLEGIENAVIATQRNTICKNK